MFHSYKLYFRKFDRSVVPIQNEMQGFDNAINRVSCTPSTFLNRMLFADNKATFSSKWNNISWSASSN